MCGFCFQLFSVWFCQPSCVVSLLLNCTDWQLLQWHNTYFYKRKEEFWVCITHCLGIPLRVLSSEVLTILRACSFNSCAAWFLRRRKYLASIVSGLDFSFPSACTRLPLFSDLNSCALECLPSIVKLTLRYFCKWF